MVRQHVNPLSRIHQLARPLPPLIELFADPCRPLHLDIGSARGRFLLAMAPWRRSATTSAWRSAGPWWRPPRTTAAGTG